MNKRWVSAVIPVYNAEKTIVGCLESVRNQTYPYIEIIAVDDGSSDQSLNLLEDYRSEHPMARMQVFSQKNAGPSAARNLGIVKAQGEFIAFLDADDVWISDKIEKQLKVFDTDPAIGLVSGWINIGRLPEGTGKGGVKDVNFRDLLYRNYFVTSTVICRKEVLEGLSFNICQKYAEDYRLWQGIASKGIKCVVLRQYVTIMDDKPLYGGSGLSANLWAMEKGELSNLLYWKSEGKLGWVTYCKASVFSYLKFIRRLIVSCLRR